MEVVEAVESDIPAILSLYREACSGEAEIPDSELLDFKSKLEKCIKSDHMLVVKEKKETVGFSWSNISAHKNSGKSIDKITMMLISPERYGEGIGAILIEREREFASSKGIDILDIEVRR